MARRIMTAVAVRLDGGVSHAALSCRTSPPQGGRIGSNRRRLLQRKAIGETACAGNVRPLRGRWPCRPEGGAQPRQRCVVNAPPVRRLQLQPARVQDRLGVAVRLLAALEHQIAGRLEGDSCRSPAPSAGRADRRRSAGRPPPPCASASPSPALGDDAVMQPVGDVLATRCAASRGPPSAPTSLMSGTFEQPTPWSIQRTT